jgi:hypothetical protein
LLKLAHKKVPEADDKTPGERLPLTHGVGGGQQGQGLKKPHLQKTKTQIARFKTRRKRKQKDIVGESFPIR